MLTRLTNLHLSKSFSLRTVVVAVASLSSKQCTNGVSVREGLEEDRSQETSLKGALFTADQLVCIEQNHFHSPGRGWASFVRSIDSNVRYFA